MALAKCVCSLLSCALAVLYVEYQIVFACPSQADRSRAAAAWCGVGLLGASQKGARGNCRSRAGARVVSWSFLGKDLGVGRPKASARSHSVEAFPQPPPLATLELAVSRAPRETSRDYVPKIGSGNWVRPTDPSASGSLARP